jgi:TolB protein
MRTATVMLALLCALVAPASAQPGEVRIDLQSGASARLPLRAEPLAAAGDRTARAMGVEADEVLAGDLDRSGVFQVARSWDPKAPSLAPQFVVGGRWEVRGASVRLTGELRDFPARRPVLVREYRGSVAEWRRLVHQFADDIVLQVTGESGVASTRIAFIVQQGRDKELWVMDADGHGARALTADRSIAQSPAWAPDGSLLLYTSFRAGTPQVWVVSPQQKRPFLVSGRPGLNTTPGYSPDGTRIACTLSQDGNAEVYSLDARGGDPRRLTHHRAIDTAPIWAPTGRELAFTSDRSGTPQVYLMDSEGGNVRRLNFDVSYTDSPAWSPKGDRIAFVSRTGAGFDIYICRPDGSGTQRVVAGGRNENPRWSPDGRMLVFTSDRGGAPALYVTHLDGSAPRMLDTGGRRALSPAWSPRLPGVATD